MKMTVHAKHNPLQYELCEKKWKAEIWEGGKVRITNGLIVDYPVKYPHNDIIAYDRPEDIPKYARKLVKEAFKFIDNFV